MELFGGNSDGGLRKTCYEMSAAHMFVTELTAIEKLKEPYAFAKGNLVPVVGSIGFMHSGG